MLRSISKIGLIALPAFMTCHLIKENKDKMKKYCPVVKYKNSKQPFPTTVSKKELQEIVTLPATIFPKV